ncbi:MAG TPA: hypothetical protein PL001_08130, partial [Candidatus Kryptobacter bacterium]|nr:hypothetical protein [Candidatus Kryptobacter bacterium]
MANNASTTETAASTDSAAETDFFSGYKWCLNPIMKLNDLWTRMESELHRFPGLKASWQCEESKVNLYLFACAISCTVDDYFSRRHYIRPLADHFPKLRRGVSLAEDMINMPLTVGGMLKFKEVSRFRAKLDEFVEHVCNLLLSTEYSVESRLLEIESCFGELRSSVVSAALGNARMRLNEGYRCQDLTYHDLITLAERYIETGPELEGRFLVVGARTAGSYFAPLLKVYLEGRGASNISWVTVRPKYGTHGIERKRLRQLLRDEPTVILTDDYSN